MDDKQENSHDTVPTTAEDSSSTKQQRSGMSLVCPSLGCFTSSERCWTTAILALVTPLPIFLMGFTFAFASSATLDLTGEASELPSQYFLPPLLISLFVALAPLGAILGGPIGGWISQHWGRKCSLMFCGVPYLTGYLMISYAHYASTTTIFRALLLSGRLISGMGFGWGSAIVPVYLGEVCSVQLRGVVGAVSQGLFTSGIAFSLALGAIEDFRYYHISLVAVGIVAVFEVLMFWLPETPRWLISRGYVEEAEEVLLWLRGKKIGVEKEMDEIKKAALMNKTKRNVVKNFSKRTVLIPFGYIVTIFFFQQSGGISATATHAATIFADAGISNPRASSIYGIGIASLVGNVAAFFLVDLVGRVTLLILSATGMFIGCMMLGIHFFVTRASLCSETLSNSTIVADYTIAESCNAHFAPLAIVSVVLYRFSFAIGMGPIPWILISELLPLSVRGVASGMVMVVTWSTSAVVVGLFLEYVALVHLWFAVWTFGFFNLAAAVFVVVFLPETKGKSLERLERKFAKLPSVVETVL